SSSHQVSISLRSVSGGKEFVVTASVVEQITHVPTEIPSAELEELLRRHQVRTTDSTSPTTEFTRVVSMIIGQDYVEQFHTGLRVPLGPALSAYETELGWMVCG